MPHELSLTTRQTTKTRNAFANNMSTGIKVSKAQISKIILPGGSFGSRLANLGKKALENVAIPLATDNLPGFNFKCYKFERKISEKAGKQEKDLLFCFE